MKQSNLLDVEAESGRLLVYDDSRSILVDIPFTEQNIESEGSRERKNKLYLFFIYYKLSLFYQV